MATTARQTRTLYGPAAVLLASGVAPMTCGTRGCDGGVLRRREAEHRVRGDRVVVDRGCRNGFLVCCVPVSVEGEVQGVPTIKTTVAK